MESSEKTYVSRLKVILALFLLIYAALLIAQFYRQIIKNGYYVALAKAQHLVAKELVAHRGNIYASSIYQKDPFLLAGNQKLFSLDLVPRQIADKNNTAEILSGIIDLKKENIFALINNDKSYIPPILDGLSYDQAQTILVKNLDGVYLLPEDRRFYPQGELAAQILGYVDNEGKGNYGLEQYYDKELKGDSGYLTAEQDVFGRYIDVNGETAPQNGTDLYLTLEMPVQFKAEQIIQDSVKSNGASSGQIIVMNPKTGEIIAMAATPSFNPENYAEAAKDKGIDIFTDPSVSKLYEPGSIFKAITMATALEKKVITTDKTFNLGASIDIAGNMIWNSDQKSHGTLDPAGILQWSDNVGIVTIEQLIGKDEFYKYLLDKFRFNLPTGVDLPNEASYESTESTAREIEAATMAFGQGIATTPLQIVTAYASIANGGKMMSPYVVGKQILASGDEKIITPQELGQTISADASKKLTDMLVSVVNTYESIKINGYEIAGKTGTAQVPSPEGGYYTNQTVQSFAGYFPAKDPQFVVLVKLDNPVNSQWAEYSTGPAFHNLAEFIINYYQLPKQ